MNTFSFLKATRFWALMAAALSVYLKAKGWIGEPEMILIATVTGGFITVRTIDRATEQRIAAAAVSTGEVKAADVIKIPPSQADGMGGGPEK